MKKTHYFTVILIISILMGCKKKHEKSDPAPDNNESSAYYIKGKVNGNSVSTVDGKNGYSIFDYTTGGSNGSGGSINSYGCSFNKLSSSEFFQLTYLIVDIEDGNDSDELPNHFKVKTDTLSDGQSPFYSLSYSDQNGKTYLPNYSSDKIRIKIKETKDLGTQKISYILEGKKNKRVVKVTGEIPSARLYEYDDQTESFTSNYVDITNLEFVVRFTSYTDVN